MEVLTEENEQTENRYGLQRVPISPNQPFSRELEFVEQTNNPILQEQAIRLFELCDWNNKGFIVRSDLDRLESVLPRAQLESVFDKQDKERVGVVNRANFLEGIKSLLLKHMNDYNMDREKKADHGLPTYINTYNPTEDASDPIRKRSSMLIIDETLNSDNSHNHDNNYFNTISLAESEDEKDGHKGGRNMRKQDTQTRQNVHQKTRKLTIAIEPSGDYENNNRVGLAKFHSIDDYGDGIIGCPSPVYSPHSDKYASNRLGSSKKNSREERNQKSKSSGRPPFSAIVPAIESPTEETSTVKNDPIKGEISPIPPPPPYRSISQPAKLPRNFSELAGNAELDGFSISEEIDPFYLNRQLSQPVHYENGQHTQFFYDYDDEEASGTAAERRNRFQFAKVIERDSISHTDLSHITPPRYGDCDFRRSTCEHSLADEMRDATRKYRGTTDLVSFLL
ncbi:EF-hand calcium-binding domain-containing protein 4A-like isoform X1 [Ditylenchus destructor]|uniref:EF-hand calcium-binding domain-containing protein 4A-like isoform X1 n=1 Tax=Ditylenchus destructor TaxID=166010 RepID=A0AAD4NFV9_9BILA|nr:EF-hand calcium-binding domain-containing protein 4A-like isoform X1 [Ditylenchus destructor]